MNMNITAYIIEEKGKIAKYILSFDEIEMYQFINSLKDEKLEEAHFFPKNQQPDNYIPTTTITSTENLITYFKSLISNKLLNLEQLNYLFKEYNNPMYSPATMKKFSQFFSLLTIKDRSERTLYEYNYIYQKKAIEDEDYTDLNNSKLKIEYAFQNKMALERLGINFKRRYIKELDKAVEKRKSLN